MSPKPLIEQLTPWRPLGEVTTAPGYTAKAWRRTVKDGMLRVLVGEEPMGWHLSVSFSDDCGRPTRYPTWDEIAHARYELLPAELDFVMHLPPVGEYVAVHPTTFHLHEHPGR